MDFLTNLGDVLTETGKNVAQKAKHLTDIAKLNMDIRYKEDYIRRQYMEIGKAFFELYQNAEEPATEEERPMFEKIALIKEAQADIAHMEGQIVDLKKQKKCSSCGSPVDVDAKFCSSCGTEFEDVKDEFEDDFEDEPAFDSEAHTVKTPVNFEEVKCDNKDSKMVVEEGYSTKVESKE